MKPQSKKHYTIVGTYSDKALQGDEIVPAYEKVQPINSSFQKNDPIDADEQLTKFNRCAGKKSFLIFKHNKYFIVPTENIAFFYIKYEFSQVVCFDMQEYSVSYSLEHIQHLLSDRQFFRLNRQYLINFDAVKEVERYFARKLLLKLVVPVKENLLVSKEKASSFLQWLENR